MYTRVKAFAGAVLFELEKSYGRKLVILLTADSQEKLSVSQDCESRALNIIQTGKNEPCRMFRCGEAPGALENILHCLMPNEN